jgi:hypothetical protein
MADPSLLLRSFNQLGGDLGQQVPEGAHGSQFSASFEMRNRCLVVVRLDGSHLAPGDCRLVVTDLLFYYLRCAIAGILCVKNV